MDTIKQAYASLEGRPKYQAVAEAIRGAIESGDMTAGEKLPPVRELAWSLQITPGTVARAYTLLTDEGRLQAEVGRGTFVAHKRPPGADDVWSKRTEAVTSGGLNLFSPHLPDVGQVDAIRQALGQVGYADPKRLLSYPTREAYKPVREAVVQWLRNEPLGGVGEQDVILTHGGQNAITLVLQTVLHGPKPVILVEELSYPGFRRAARTLRAEVVSVEMDAHGIRPDSLAATARRTGAQVLCTSPEVHNPTTAHTPLERRRELVEVARRFDLQILEDDCYRLAPSQAPSYRVLAPGRGWYVASISKLLTPALRIGYAVAPKGQGAGLRSMAEYGFFGLAQPLAEVTELLLTDPRTEGLVDEVRRVMSGYIRVAVNVLGAHDLHWRPEVPFLWLRLPAGWRAASFARAAEGEGVQLRSADEFALRDGRAPHAVRIAINAQVSLRRFEEGLLKLRDLLEHPPEQISV